MGSFYVVVTTNFHENEQNVLNHSSMGGRAARRGGLTFT